MVRFQNGWLYTYQVFDLAIPESGSYGPLKLDMATLLQG